MVMPISTPPASPFQEAAARIHEVLEGVDGIGKTDFSALDGAFHTIDHRDIETVDDAIAVLSVARLMLDYVLQVHTQRVETDGDAQLLMFAMAYVGRSVEALEMNRKEEVIATGRREM